MPYISDMNFVQDLCEDLYELFKVNRFLVLTISENEINLKRVFPNRANLQFTASDITACRTWYNRKELAFFFIGA